MLTAHHQFSYYNAKGIFILAIFQVGDMHIMTLQAKVQRKQNKNTDTKTAKQALGLFNFQMSYSHFLHLVLWAKDSPEVAFLLDRPFRREIHSQIL